MLQMCESILSTGKCVVLDSGFCVSKGITALSEFGVYPWYLAVTEVNTALADGHFRKGGKLIPNLQFRSKLAHEMMDNTIGGGGALWILRGRGGQRARQMLFLASF